MKALLSASQRMLKNTSGNIWSNWSKNTLSNLLFLLGFGDCILNDCLRKITQTSIWTSHAKTSSTTNVLSIHSEQEYHASLGKTSQRNSSFQIWMLVPGYLWNSFRPKIMHRQDFKFIEKIQLEKKFLKVLMLCISLQYQSRSQLSIWIIVIFFY